jgi:hypothetical protein
LGFDSHNGNRLCSRYYMGDLLDSNRIASEWQDDAVGAQR